MHAAVEGLNCLDSLLLSVLSSSSEGDGLIQLLLHCCFTSMVNI